VAAPSGKRRDSARRKRAELDAARRAARGRAVSTDLGDVELGPAPLPRWYKVLMFGLMILGLLWICTFYLTQGLFPIVGLGSWNILIGFGMALVGFLMMSRWTE